MTTQGAELWDELQPLRAQLHTHARELRESDAQVIAMWNDDVAELLEVGAKRGQLGDELRSRQLRVRRHASKVRSAPRRRHGAGVVPENGEEYIERAVTSGRRKHSRCIH